MNPASARRYVSKSAPEIIDEIPKGSRLFAHSAR
jgi:hypothetical protein